MFKAIYLGHNTNYIDKENNPLVVLHDLNRFNIFIGENNSGKSRLARSFLSNDDSRLLNSKIDGDISSHINRLISNINQNISYLNRYPNIDHISLDYTLIQKLFASGNYYEIYKILSTNIYSYIQKDTIKNNSNQSVSNSVNNLLENIESFSLVLSHRKPSSTKQYREALIGKCVYIPILRGIEGFDSYFNKDVLEIVDDALLNKSQWKAIEDYAKNSSHIYEDKISKVYNIDKRCIFTAENLYDGIKSNLLGNETQRQLVKDFQEFISKEFYGGEGFLLTPKDNRGDGSQNMLMVKIGKGKERPIYDLGDGIKQMISILYKIFEYRNQEFLFIIEEPESNLHPGFQKKLMKILQSDIFSKLQFIIITHSNHILESFLGHNDISIFKTTNTMQKDIFRVVRTGSNDLSILDLLGVSNMSVLLANCLIFVEGLSDKILIRKYLDVYFAHNNLDFQEGIHYAFVETGGGNIAHWSFTKHLADDDVKAIRASDFSSRSFVICDNDGNKKKDRKKYIENMVGSENFYELPVREIENTIKRNVLEKALFCGSNVSIKKQYDEEKNGYYNQRYIGKFIDSHYNLNHKVSSTSGTINNKIKFASKVIESINYYEDLSTSAIDLCDKLSDFITRSNSI